MNVYEGAEAIIRELMECLKAYVPDSNCSCHLNPPCNDCVEHGHERITLENAKSTIARLQWANGYLPVKRY